MCEGTMRYYIIIYYIYITSVWWWCAVSLHEPGFISHRIGNTRSAYVEGSVVYPIAGAIVATGPAYPHCTPVA